MRAPTLSPHGRCQRRQAAIGAGLETLTLAFDPLRTQPPFSEAGPAAGSSARAHPSLRSIAASTVLRFAFARS